MELGLKGKVAIVMASSSGLGKAIAREFLEEGAKVVMASRSEDKLAHAAAEIGRDMAFPPLYRSCDITNPSEIQELVGFAVEKLGPVSVLVNNAGGPPAGTFDSFGDDAWQKAFELNLLSYVRTIREVLPLMKEQKWGRIVNSTSSSVRQVIENLILSNTFRLGVIGLTKTLSQELAPHNILVNAIGPGRFNTGRIRQLDMALAEKKGMPVEEVARQSLSRIPLGRYGDPAEYGRLAVFLCSGANTYITGQTIIADGGMVRAVP
ncbi:MAG TPA: SDR family oxidoreductase [Synergistales bacterium]|nr:SDR family oxidoreductase [Synergistales bacterium]